MSADPLFTPIKINQLAIANRIYMPAMHLNMCRNYQVTEQLLAFYAERARGGAGMITVGYASVDEVAAQPLHIGAHDDKFIPGLTRLANTIKKNGARASVQLNHAGRYNHSMLLGGKQPVGPSAIASRLTGETPHALSLDEIAATIASFAAAAGRVKQAAFDAVEILCGTGYLISSFLSPATNQRTDDYGGSPAKRMRFGLDVVRAVRAEVGSEFPLLVRVNGNDFMPNGIGREPLREFVRQLEAAGADAFCVNVGWHESRVPQIQTKVPRGVYAYLARSIREVVTVPVIASHRINDPKIARELLNEGSCDMVAMGRALIADPELPEKARTGREREIVHCVACAQGCFDHLFEMRAVECLCNPRAGHELQENSDRAETPKAVLVIGGGPGGMSAALAASERGHRVTLVEQSNRLGGQLLLAGAAPGRAEFVQLATDLAQQVAISAIELRLGTRADRALVEQLQPEVVIMATGGAALTPPIPGAELSHVVQAWDVLSGKVEVGRNVVIIGGGAVGVETALELAEQGTLSADALKFLLVHEAADLAELRTLATHGTRKVMVLEMLDKLGANFGKTTRWVMLDDMQRYGVETLTGAKALEITAQAVKVEHCGKVVEFSADTVVLAAGTRLVNPLQQELEGKGVVCHVIGDAKRPAMVFDAVHQGYATGLKL
ncbi:MAG: FAD-dependent oxidoreductase [Desulfuromonadales bacterium]|nr:FAD-dependent oxidoreductase [Desulfuromonadales bacterium]MDT8422856.1 FAD-dependent oxidoreductase [Desulfuromonadales bacterium]